MSDTTTNFLRINDQQTKNISVVVVIDGVDLIANGPIYTQVRYGDPGVFYGDADLYYGGMRRIDGVRQLLSLEGSNLTLSQKNEPEQGRASVTTLAMSFIDKDQYMTQVISRGVIVPEILGRNVEVWLGYTDLSYPEDYLRIFRGKITAVDSAPGIVSMQFSDPNFNRRQQVFLPGKSQLIGSVTDSDTTINVFDNADFPAHILGPNGVYDVYGPWNSNGTYNPLAAGTTGIRTFLKVEDEYIEYGPLGFGSNQFTGCIRGARGTTAVAHASATEIVSCVEFTDNALVIALKAMLSGKNGTWITGVQAYSFVSTFDPVVGNQPQAVLLPSQVDAKIKYGLVEGDYVTITGGVNNGISAKILRLEPLFGTTNRLIYLDTTLAAEFPAVGMLSFRSKYDTWPVTCGLGLTPQDVDIATHEQIQGDFINDTGDRMRFFMTGVQTGKSWLELQVYLPSNTYSITRRGKVSVGYTKPPIAGETLEVLDRTNVLNPDKVKPMRSLTSSRKFWNEIDWDYDYNDAGKATTLYRALDVDSISTFGVSSMLPIRASGIRTDLGSFDRIQRRSQFFLSRYKNAAVLFSLEITYGKGILIEAGDVVALKDNGALQISNFATGERNIGFQLYEVLERTLDIKQGKASLTLVSDIGADVSDRFAVISPSSIVVDGSSSELLIQDSFGSIYPGNESRKWKDYIGLTMRLHSEDYSFDTTFTLLNVDPANPYKLLIDDLAAIPMSFSGLVVDIIDYPNTTSKTDAQLIKQLHGFFDDAVPIVSGASQTVFTVAAGDIGRFIVGSTVRVHTEDYSTYSAEVNVESVDTMTYAVTVSEPLGFTPNNTFFCTGLFFPDGQGAYRLI